MVLEQAWTNTIFDETKMFNDYTLPETIDLSWASGVILKIFVVFWLKPGLIGGLQLNIVEMLELSQDVLEDWFKWFKEIGYLEQVYHVLPSHPSPNMSWKGPKDLLFTNAWRK